MNQRHLYLLALSLTIFSLGLFAYKAAVLQFPLVPQTQAELWNIETT